MKLLKFFIILLLLTTNIYSEVPHPSTQTPLVIGCEEFPPFEFTKDGKATGIDVDIIQKIMDKLNIPIEFRFYPFARINMLLKRGSIDAASSISYKSKREHFLYYSNTQKDFVCTGKIPEDSMWTSKYVFFINRRFSDSIRFDSYEQIKKDKYRVGIIRDYSYNKEFTDADLDKYIYASQPEALRALAEGIIDIFPCDRTVGLWLLQEYNFDKQLTFISRPLFCKPYNMAFSKKTDYPNIKNIMTRFNEELKKMKKSGEINKIKQKYLQIINTPKNTRPLLFVCEEWKPFEYMEDNKVKGIDAEIIDVIMKRLCIPYEIKIYPWSRAWMMAQKGKADAIISISYKPSREPILYYTQEQREFSETGKIPTDYLWKSEYVFFVKKSNVDKINFNSYKQLVNDGYIIGKNKDYSYDNKFTSINFNNKLYHNTDEGLLALASGDIDLYPMDKHVGLETLHSLGLSDSITYLPKILFSKPYLIPFCKKSNYPDLENIMIAFYKELNLMRKSGEYKRIHKKMHSHKD
jgi:polar amino acid transport system substrate-binding protein